jgi:hypothetical protein
MFEKNDWNSASDMKAESMEAVDYEASSAPLYPS